MPSKEHLEVKQQIVAEIKEKFEKAQSAVVIDYKGITVAEADAMRKKLREAGVDYNVYKNTLVSKAIAGTGYEGLNGILSGPSAFAFGYEDAVAPARVLNGVIKDFKKMEFKGGYVEGTYYDAAGIQSIALLPGREELIAKFLGSIQSPVSKLVRTFQAIADAKEQEA
jgi:large subunit ribosomal protein L10